MKGNISGLGDARWRLGVFVGREESGLAQKGWSPRLMVNLLLAEHDRPSASPVCLRTILAK